jgi:uncharacterized membrane protein YgdD (TMEM256/DUF423 family)
MDKIFLVFGAVFGFTGVAAGAFGAHGLRDILPVSMLHVFETAVRYQMFHAIALIIAGWGTKQYNTVYFKIAGWAYIIGIFLFSGSLYTLALTEAGRFGVITPFGGVSFLAGWIFTGLGFLSKNNRAEY